MEQREENSVRRNKSEKKLLRKQIKANYTLMKHEGVSTTSELSKSLMVANGGLGNGVSREELSAVLKEMGELEAVVMLPDKPYAFVTYRSEESAQKAHAHLNGQKLQCGENSVVLYLSFVKSVACEAEMSVALPEGLVLLEDFVSPEEETVLLATIDWSSTEDDVTAQKELKHRRVKHYGFEFRYDNNNVDKDRPLPAGLPEECLPILERCLKNGHISIMPDQLTINQYESGQGIPPHVDTHSAFEDTILSLSLGAKSVMEFRHPDGRVVSVVLPARSLLVMKGESRYLWTHGITPRKFDVVPSCDPQCLADTPPVLGTNSNLTLSKRGTRTSFTFRKIRHKPCRCAFPSACDSLRASTPSPSSLPRHQADAARLEEEYVHQVYDAIASHFSSTRHSPWPRVCGFLSSLSPGSLLVDVGCGNGKYLAVSPGLFAVGCDRSKALVDICAERGYQVFVSDALSVPLRTSTCDACISVAVIHHFSTEDRRLAAVRELIRLLKPGGRALIYVWAFEQEYNQQRSKYLKDDNKEHPRNRGPIYNMSEDQPDRLSEDEQQSPARHTDSTSEDGSSATDGKLSVHTNRTAFKSQDLLVPWHLKKGKGKSGKGGSGDSDASLTAKARLDYKQDSGSGFGSNPDICPRVDTSAASQEPDSSPAPVFHRYYHVFQQGELEHLCGQVAGVKVQSSYYDQGNWCVILQKD